MTDSATVDGLPAALAHVMRIDGETRYVVDCCPFCFDRHAHLAVIGEGPRYVPCDPDKRYHLLLDLRGLK